MKFFALAAACLSAVPAFAQDIDVGTANWDNMPRLVKAERTLPYADLVTQVETILSRKQCVLKSQKPHWFDITVPYAVNLDAGGNAVRILVAEQGCRPIEMLVGNIAADLARLGDFKQKDAIKPGWYASSITFTLR